ncbi:MAG: tRNA dihydrouridine synthase DusB [Spirochaetes bacterium]|nr:tRNA dihydrouridine synthase DusB [Spirochaetota bacterium]
MFYHQVNIKNLILRSNIFIAPLAGYTNLPTRKIYRQQGAGIAYAEMVSAEGLNYNFKKSSQIIDTDQNDQPLGIQLFGKNAERILLAFSKIKDQPFDLIDINCGCSVKKIIKSEAGASLLKDPELIYQIIFALKKETEKPVTLKIRSGWDQAKINFEETYSAAVSAGADLITLHPRTKSMLFTGKADWSHIKRLKEQSSIPVIGNGDLFSGSDAVAMIKATGCDGIMLARGLIENPFLVEETLAALQGQPYSPPTLERKLTGAFQHAEALVKYFGEPKGLLEFRKILRGYIKGLPGVSRLKQAANQVSTLSAFQAILKEYQDYLQINK